MKIWFFFIWNRSTVDVFQAEIFAIAEVAKKLIMERIVNEKNYNFSE